VQRDLEVVGEMLRSDAFIEAMRDAMQSGIADGIENAIINAMPRPGEILTAIRDGVAAALTTRSETL
jgi:hypothetical protein